MHQSLAGSSGCAFGLLLASAAASQCLTSWTPLDATANTGPDDVVYSVAAMPNGDVIAGGYWTTVSGMPANCIARWNGVTWSPLGGGSGVGVVALAALSNGDLIASGWFTTSNIARWDGVTWSPLGVGTNGVVRAIAIAGNGDVIAGGSFTTAGGVPANNIARWNGVTWSPLGSGITNGQVNAVAIADNGDVIAGGLFSSAGGSAAFSVARWTGGSWVPLGATLLTSVAGEVYALTIRPNGDVVAGGHFSVPFGNNAAIWNGSVWSSMGWGNDWVRALATLPNGDVLAGCIFPTSWLPTGYAARWDGSAWSAIAASVSSSVWALAAAPSGDVVAGGAFLFAGGAPARRVARLTTTCPTATNIVGAGCTFAGSTTALTATSPPWAGSTFRSRATGFSTNALAAVIYGFAPLAMPMPSVHPLGQPGCVLRATDDILLHFARSSGSVDCEIAIPAAPTIVGFTFWHQVVPVELDAQNNIIALTATNALALTVGWL